MPPGARSTPTNTRCMQRASLYLRQSAVSAFRSMARTEFTYFGIKHNEADLWSAGGTMFFRDNKGTIGLSGSYFAADAPPRRSSPGKKSVESYGFFGEYYPFRSLTLMVKGGGTSEAGRSGELLRRRRTHLVRIPRSRIPHRDQLHVVHVRPRLDRLQHQETSTICRSIRCRYEHLGRLRSMPIVAGVELHQRLLRSA